MIKPVLPVLKSGVNLPGNRQVYLTALKAKKNSFNITGSKDLPLSFQQMLSTNMSRGRVADNFLKSCQQPRPLDTLSYIYSFGICVPGNSKSSIF